MRHIRESKDIAEICREWTFQLTRKGSTNDADNGKGANQLSQMLKLIQTLAGSPSLTAPLKSTQSDVKNADTEMVVSAHCCSFFNLARTKAQSISSGEKELKRVTSNTKSKSSIILGFSGNVEVRVDILEGKPHFDISMTPPSKVAVQERYLGLYCWPRQSEQGQADLFLGEFSNGADMC
jgi:hypothetical protein